jgi:hypothetical protein
MARPKWAWLASLTQHGEKPPWMLRYRSSEGFIVGTISLAVFTVRCLGLSRLVWKTSSLTVHLQDMFLYGVIVPVIPFALESKDHVQPNRGTILLLSL